MAIHAIVVAAGSGKRFGGKKQFALVHGKPLFAYATGVFQSQKQIDAITLVVPRREINRTRITVRSLGFDKVRYVVAGGRRRQDSVVNGLRTVKGRTGIVIIHDAARPLVTGKMISRGIAMCRRYKSVILGISVRDTVKRAVRRNVQETISRQDLYLVQTPQFYDLRTIRQAIDRADFRVEYTDEAAILESLGTPVHMGRGDQHNIKITDRRDLKFAEKLLK
ncbi:2-C-methyl-D-erythritol 4-phosphate cytidylyltransferase [candidate division WOR-3 bacterium]|nr:2-C-methyl-D-erythritol 4-phosphate cytidylyltransferase [candidate division WOR-3 bacterium]